MGVCVSELQSRVTESLRIALLGPDLPGNGPTAGWRAGGRGGTILKRAIESFVWCLWLMGAGQCRKGVALVVQASRGRAEGAGTMVSRLEEAAELRGARGPSQGWGTACGMGAFSSVECDCLSQSFTPHSWPLSEAPAPRQSASSPHPLSVFKGRNLALCFDGAPLK